MCMGVGRDQEEGEGRRQQEKERRRWGRLSLPHPCGLSPGLPLVFPRKMVGLMPPERASVFPYLTVQVCTPVWLLVSSGGSWGAGVLGLVYGSM